MLAKADHHQLAIDDYLRALDDRSDDASGARWIGEVGADHCKKPAEVAASAARRTPHDRDAAAAGRALEAAGRRRQARRGDCRCAREAAAASAAVGLEQLASLFADSGDTVQLDADRRRASRRSRPTRRRRSTTPPSAAFLHGDANEAVAQRATRDRDRSELRADLRPDRRRLYEAQPARSGAAGVPEIAVVRRARQHRLRKSRRAGAECGESRRWRRSISRKRCGWCRSQRRSSREGLRRARTGSP